MMNEKTCFGGLDRFRLAAALLVVAIHTSPLTCISQETDFLLTRVFARVAVPFFLMVTGQFVLPRILEPGPGAGRKLRRYLTRTGGLYLVCIALYLPLGIYAGHYKDLNPGQLLRLLVWDGAFYHLWYFPACMLGMSLLWLLSRRLGVRALAFVCGVLYLFGLCGDSYYGLTAYLPPLRELCDLGFRVWSHTRNGLFLAPLFLLMGAYMGKQCKQPSEKALPGVPVLGAGLALCLAGMSGEAFLLRYLHSLRHDSMYLLLIPVMYCLYGLLLSADRWKPEGCPPSLRLRRISTVVYILHPAVIVAVRICSRLPGLQSLTDQSLIHYLAVCLLSLAAAWLLTALPGSRTKARPEPSETDSSGTVPCARAWIELDLDALRHNVKYLQSLLPRRCALMPVVKANAYGHGAGPIARELNALGIRAFCVACVSEGIELRAQNITGEILVLGYTHPEQFSLLDKYTLTQTAVDHAHALALSAYACSVSRQELSPLPIHIAVDTGMHRLGEPAENMSRIREAFSLPGLRITGMYTHLAASGGNDDVSRNFTEKQIDAFYKVKEYLGKDLPSYTKLHLQASYGILRYPLADVDCARPGIALYGLLSNAADTHAFEDRLRPVLSLRARVASVHRLAPGESAGYDMAYTATRPTVIATVTIGYADGLPRSISHGKGALLLRGQRAPIVGRVCMDQLLADVSDLPTVRPGDIATLIGKDGKEHLSAADLADTCGVITNELLSSLGPRLERPGSVCRQGYSVL